MRRVPIRAARGRHTETLPLLPASNPPGEGAFGALQHFFSLLVIHRSLFALVVRELAVLSVSCWSRAPSRHIGVSDSLISGASHVHGCLREELP